MIRLRKVVYQVHMDQVDDSGNVLEELSTQEPLSLWSHQLDQLPAQVAAVLAQAEAQAEPKDAPENGNRAQRRAAAKRPKKLPPARTAG